MNTNNNNIDNEHIFKLDNGLRIILTQKSRAEIVHCSMMIGAGSSDENIRNNGIAHFIEHMVFKRTKTRKSFQILNRLETIGGEINAYTTREKTCFYTSTEKKYFERSMELLTDIVFKSVFLEKDIEKEKKVVLEEIEMYEDSPDESIFDEFHEKIFKGSPLSYNILGKKSTINKFSRKDILDFMKKNYTTDNIVISIVGSISPKKLENVINKYLKDIPASKKERKRINSTNYKSFVIDLKKKYSQTHCMIGNIAYSGFDKKRFGLLLLNNVIGGEWMSSRLNMSIREKNAFAYNVNSTYSIYGSSGLFSVHFGTDIKYLQRSKNLVDKEFKLLREKKLTKVQLNRSKRQLKGKYAYINDSNSWLMITKATNLLEKNYIYTKEEFFSNIEEITSEGIIKIANEVLCEKTLSTLIYK
ncbi:MAG: pitrilysin family protein [Bacteroidota bacterium]|nr:pitrilysin family protein [Bacteroidota bacterium]